MCEFSFNVKQETIERNIAEFAKLAAKYVVEYSIAPFTLDESRVTVKAPCTSKVALLAGILTHKEEE